MASNPPGRCCTLGSLFEGTPTGSALKVDGNIDAYLAKAPEDKARKGRAILYLPDVFGVWQNSKVMADAFASCGYTTLVLDLFDGDALTLNQLATLDIGKWLSEGTDGKHPHTVEQVDPIVLAGIKALRGMGFDKIAAVGYCFGAKYVVRHHGHGIAAGFVAHPSFIDEAELAALTVPLSIAAAETDSIFPAELRHKSEEILRKTGQPYQINLFSGVSHGFAVRCDRSKPVEQFAMEQAFGQAVAWFEAYVQA